MRQKGKALIVDDDPKNRAILEHLLEDLCECRLACGGEEALTLVEDFPPDIILLDIMMPEMDGYETCRRIKKVCPHSKVILISAKTMVEERIQGYEAGADDYLAKPFDHEEFLAKARVFLKLRKTEQELVSLNASLEEKVRIRTEELTKMHRQVLQASKLASIGELASGIAHEINNPLTIIKGNIDFMKEYLGNHKDTVLTPILDQQDGAVDRIVNIVNGLRVHARMDSGQMVPLNLHALIDQSVAMVRQIFGKREITLQKEYRTTAPFIRGNPGRFQQILINLFTNARDAVEGRPGALIRVITESDDKIVRVSVADNGGGIPEPVKARIFEPFFTTKEAGRGTGLGLSIVNSIVNEMGGEIHVDSAVGKGTVFVISFSKLVASEIVEVAQPSEATESQAMERFSGTVLIVDDEEEIGAILAKYLEDFGFQVERASDGISAFALMKKRRFDLLLTDLQMPRMRGDELVHTAKRLALLEKTRVIALTGNVESTTCGQMSEELKGTFHGFMMKPFSKSELYKVLKSVL